MEQTGRREKIREEKVSEERRSRCPKRCESRETLCFSNDLWLRRVESRLAKQAGAEPTGQMRDEKLHAIVAQSTFPSQKAQNNTKHTMFGPLLEVEMSKKCTPLWREAHLQVKKLKTSRSDHFWKLRCRKSARRAHFQVKTYKTPQLRSTFRSCAVENVHAVLAQSTFRSQNVKSTTCSRHFLDVQMSFRVAGARDCGPCQK